MPQALSTPTLGETLASQFGFAHYVTLQNLGGISDEEALIAPQAGGNCINWITGHLITARQRFLVAFDQPEVLPSASATAYQRGSKPGQHMPERLSDLHVALVRSYEMLSALLPQLDDATLVAPAPFSPGSGTDTVGSLLMKLVIHDSYHGGQIGIVRRTLGKPGAIA